MAATLPAEKKDEADKILANGEIDANDVLSLRREIYPDGVIDAEEVDLLFYLDQHDAGMAPEWADLFVEALTDFFVWQQYPPGVLSDEEADRLVDLIMKDGRIATETEFRLLANILKYAKWCPEKVALLALEGVKQAVETGDGRLVSNSRQRAGVIDAEDVRLIRDVIHGAGGEDSLVVTEREADLLFDLNNATQERDNDPEWRDLFVKAVASYALHPARRMPKFTPEDHQRHERWLNERRGTSGFISEMGKAVANGSALAEAFRAAAKFLPGGATKDEEEGVGRLSQEIEDALGEPRLEAPQAKWLIKHIHRDGTVHENEKALLTFIRERAVTIDPAIEPLMKELGV